MQRPPIGMSVRRGSLKLKALGRAHGPLHMLLWQAREAQTTLIAAAAAQKTLFTDIAAWASSENRALNDVCSCASELSSFYSGALTQLAIAFKSFRKEMSVVLEGEKRCDTNQKKLQDAEQKRIKLRRQVLKSQNRTISEGTRQSADFTQLQSQLAEAERAAERAHLEACDASREQEAVKLVVLKSAFTKLSQSHLSLSSQMKVIFDGNLELTNLLPEPPPPGDPLSCIRYTAYDTSKEIVDRVKRAVNVGQSPAANSGASSSSRRSSGAGSSRPLSTSTPVTSPNSSMWSSAEPSAPPSEPPPPYNTSYISSSPHSRNTSQVFQSSPQRTTCHHVRSSFPNSSVNETDSSLPSYSTSSLHYRNTGSREWNNSRDNFNCSSGHLRNNSTVSVRHLFQEHEVSYSNPD